METDTNGFEGFDLWKPLVSEEAIFLASDALLRVGFCCYVLSDEHFPAHGQLV